MWSGARGRPPGEIQFKFLSDLYERSHFSNQQQQRFCWFTSDQSVLCPLLELSTCNIQNQLGQDDDDQYMMMCDKNDSDDETDGEQIEELKTLPQIARRW